MPSILAHPEWPLIRPHLRAEAVDRDTNPDGDPRYRIEVVEPDDSATRTWLLDLVVPCVRCGLPMHPVRQRAGWGSYYYAAACPLSITTACARGADAAAEYRTIVEDLLAHPFVDPRQPSLF